MVYPHPIVLLWVQDAAVAGTGLVAYFWILDYLERRKVSWWPAAGAAVVVLAVLVVNPGVYQTLFFDFHMETISTFFLVLAGRDVWLGRHRRAWIWVAGVLLCGTFAAVTLIGLGISAVLAGKDTRRQGLYLLGAAVGWLFFISVIGANAGSGLASYAYLTGRATLPANAGIAVVVTGMLSHPSRVVHELHLKLHYFWLLIKPVGVVGLASAWGFGVPVVVMVTNGLNFNYEFILQAFQSFAVFPFLLLGTVMVLVWLAQRFRFGWLPCVVLALVLTVQALAYGITNSPGNIRWAIDNVPAAAGAQIRKALALTPPQAEVITSTGIMGRFSDRPHIYFFSPNGTYPVNDSEVEFVFDPAREQAAGYDDAAIAYVGSQLHARPVLEAAGIYVFQWHPPAGVKSVRFPPAG
jgi:hypothetical protein